MRILVVEDDASLADGLTSALSRAGHAATQAHTGRGADALLASEDYDLVVLDIRLPDVDGFEVLRRLRAAARWPTSSCSRRVMRSKIACTASISVRTIT
jgi:DNA-binding response OmpR family regulator